MYQIIFLPDVPPAPAAERERERDLPAGFNVKKVLKVIHLDLFDIEVKVLQTMAFTCVLDE